MDADAREELLLALHRAATEKPAWERFLQRCCTRLDLSYASLIFRHGPGTRVDAEFHAGSSVTEDLKQRYRRYFRSLDPVLYFAMEPGRSYRLPELLRRDAGSDHPYRREFLEPAGLSYMISARIVEDSGETAWLSFCRASTQPDFSSQDQQLFDSLLPHMAVGLRTFLLVERQRVRAAIGRHVSSRFDMAAIALTRQGKVLGMGPLARAIIAQSRIVTLAPDGQLHLLGGEARAQFAEAMAAAKTTGHSKPLLFTKDGQRLEMLVAPFDGAAGQGVVRPDVVLYMRQDAMPGPDAHVRSSVADMFGLTPTEADIAWGLASGRALGQLAGDLKLSENTVRSYTKSIYAKLGVRRQVDLVRLLLISVTQLG